MIETIRVRVGLTVKEYPADIAGYGEHLAAGGATLSLGEARRQARQVLAAATAPDWLAAVDFWVTLDESGLAYRATFTRKQRHRIVAAAPLPGPFVHRHRGRPRPVGPALLRRAGRPAGAPLRDHVDPPHRRPPRGGGCLSVTPPGRGVVVSRATV